MNTNAKYLQVGDKISTDRHTGETIETIVLNGNWVLVLTDYCRETGAPALRFDKLEPVQVV